MYDSFNSLHFGGQNAIYVKVFTLWQELIKQDLQHQEAKQQIVMRITQCIKKREFAFIKYLSNERSNHNEKLIELQKLVDEKRKENAMT